MPTQEQAYFRQDLIIKSIRAQGDRSERYLIKDKESGATFEFGKEEFFLCQSLDGKSTPEQIVAKFKHNFGYSLSLEDLNGFVQQINEFGLLASRNYLDLDSSLAPLTDLSEYNYNPEVNQAKIDKSTTIATPVTNTEELTSYQTSSPPRKGLSLFKAEPVFHLLATLFKPVSKILVFLTWALIPLVILAYITWHKNQFIIQQNLALTSHPLSFLGTLCLHLLSINLFSNLIRGTIAAIYGAQIEDFGIHLRWGIMPRFYTQIVGIDALKRKQQLWLYGSPLLFRLYIFCGGVFLWYSNRGTLNSLTTWGIIFANLGLLSFLHGALPIRPSSPGAKFICLYLGKPYNYTQKLKRRLLKSLGLMVRNPSRGLLLSRTDLIMLLGGVLVGTFFAFVISRIVLRIATGLASSIPNIFGKSTFYVILGLLLLLVINSLKGKSSSSKSSQKIDQNTLNTEPKAELTDNTYKLVINKEGLPILQPKLQTWRSKIFNYKTLIFIILIAAFFLPCPYAPGGKIQLLPPQAQQIQAPISGQIKRVFFPGGDGKLIKGGTVLAEIASAEVQNSLITFQEKIEEQQATIEKQQANLNKLLATPRKEEIEVSKAKLEVARQEVEIVKRAIAVAQQKVNVAKQHLESAQINAKYSAREVERLQGLYEQGAFALQRVEDARKKAETDKISIVEMRSRLELEQKNVAEVQQNLAAKQKNVDEALANLQLILSGVPQEEIEAARQEVASAKAQLRQLQQQLDYAQEQDESRNLVMPFDGYIVDSYLQRKVGIYLNQGETFASVQDDSNLFVEVEVPEYDVGEIPVGAIAQVKLLAYPNEQLFGKVIAIEPASSEQEYGRVFNLLVEVEDSQKNLRPGMSGYGKVYVGKKPLIMLLSRPLTRFVQIEFWSWLP